MSDTPTADSRGDESDDPLGERESIVARSTQRFEPQSTAEDAELAYYLETKPRKARRGGHSAPARPAAPAPQNRNDPHNKDFLGSSEDEFEAAFRSLEKQTSSAPVRRGSVFKNEPVFAEPPPQDYSRTFAQAFEEKMASSPGTSSHAFETRAEAFDFDTRSVTVTAVTGLVFVAVIGALIYSCVGVKNTGEPIVIKTDTSAVKNMAAAETERPSSSKPIYDRLGTTDDSNNEKIVSREEQPGDNLQAPNADSAAVPAAPASPPQASSTTPPMILPNRSAQETGTLNTPRQVPTTTIRVRPDGTMENIPSSADTTSAALGWRQRHRRLLPPRRRACQPSRLRLRSGRLHVLKRMRNGPNLRRRPPRLKMSPPPLCARQRHRNLSQNHKRSGCAWQMLRQRRRAPCLQAVPGSWFKCRRRKAKTRRAPLSQACRGVSPKCLRVTSLRSRR